MIGSNQRLYLP